MTGILAFVSCSQKLRCAAALSSSKAVMPEDAINEREKRLRGDEDSLDDVDRLLTRDERDVEAGGAPGNQVRLPAACDLKQ